LKANKAGSNESGSDWSRRSSSSVGSTLFTGAIVPHEGVLPAMLFRTSAPLY